jgi:hypothetical protein
MSPLEVTGFGALWLVFLVLAGLLLVLYRQVEKAYETAEIDDKGALLPGVEVPDVEVIADYGIAPLELPPDAGEVLLAITSASCSACSTLVKTLADDGVSSGRRVVLVEGDSPAGLWGAPRNVEIWALAHPPDVIRHFGVTNVPLLYVLDGNVVQAVAVASERDEVVELVREGRRRAASSPGRESPSVIAVAPAPGGP